MPERVRVYWDKFVKKVPPVYPQKAKRARVQGTVRLEVVISKTGTVLSVRRISGHPLLVPAAMGAVKQWKYQPVRLVGVPVEVITTADVNFTLTE